MIYDAVLHEDLLTAALPASVCYDEPSGVWVQSDACSGVLYSINADKTGVIGSPGELIPNTPEKVFTADITFEPSAPGTFTEGDFTGLAYVPVDFYTARYSASIGGSISGDTNQVTPGIMIGLPVTAVPDPGYTFVVWSDGVTDATRTDITWTDVTALFAETVSDIYILQQYKE